MDRPTRRLTLELTGEAPPEGIAYDERGAGRPFSGWLGLLGALGALVGDGGPEEHRDPLEDEDGNDPTHRR